MKKILIDQIRIDGFRGLTNFTTSLSETTVFTGMNNVGKTSILKAIQMVFGNHSFLTSEDFHIEGNSRTSKIFIDVRIVPVDENGLRLEEFDDDWAIVLKSDLIERDSDERSYVGVRTTFTNNEQSRTFFKEVRKLNVWEQDGIDWKQLRADKRCSLPLEQMPFFYIDAQRDILEDVKSRNSYIGRMLSKVSDNYSKEEVDEIESMISSLNERAIANSQILTSIQDALSGLDSTMDNEDSTVKILPFAKKLRDLNKSLSIQYGTNEDSFTMDYHGMGTRSWSSLLTFKAFLKLMSDSVIEGEVYCPIIAIEEPESHLHPNAQKQLFNQMKEISGIKIISTHSPYVAASADLSEIRGLYKKETNTVAGRFNSGGLHEDDVRNIQRQVIYSHGELLFSKAIVLFEGETESQALPILAEKSFRMPCANCGINFVGVGGYGSYAPYIRFAEAFNIPWFIFSDGENDAIKGVSGALKKAMGDENIDIANQNNIFIIPNGKNYEQYITTELDYLHEFRGIWIKGITETHPKAIEAKKKDIETYDATIFCEKATSHKTRYATPMAMAIAESDKGLPPLISQLFEKIKSTLYSI